MTAYLGYILIAATVACIIAMNWFTRARCAGDDISKLEDRI